MIGKTLSGSILIHYQIPSLSQRKKKNWITHDTESHMGRRFSTLSVKHAIWLLKEKIRSAPVLIFLDFDKPFLLETDASGEGLGAMFSQKQDDGCYHPVAFGSRALTPSEQNYHSSKLEFLALKWSITKHFKEYLEYTPFIVWTDNNPLTDVMTMPNLDVTGHHIWCSE